MTEDNKSKYIELWERFLPLIVQTIRNTSNNRSYTVLNPYEFMLVGNLKNYSFTISYSGGKITNNIKCSVVARGLAAALESSAEAAQLIREGNLTIRMDKNFCLWISRPETAKDLLLDFGP